MKLAHLWLLAIWRLKPHKNVDQYTVCGSFGPDLCVSFLQILFTNTPPSIPGHPISLFAPKSIKLVSRGDRCDLSPCVCPIQMPVQWTRTSKDSEWSWHLQDCSSPRGFFHTLHVFFFCLERITLCLNCRVWTRLLDQSKILQPTTSVWRSGICRLAMTGPESESFVTRRWLDVPMKELKQTGEVKTCEMTGGGEQRVG